MRRPALILVAGMAAAVLAYAGVYYSRTADCCHKTQGGAPELAWLKQEFGLGDAEFKRIAEMHDSYLSGCAERCHRIDLKNQEVARLLAANEGRVRAALSRFQSCSQAGSSTCASLSSIRRHTCSWKRGGKEASTFHCCSVWRKDWSLCIGCSGFILQGAAG